MSSAHQPNGDLTANTTNIPPLTTYPLLLQHLHSTNAFVEKPIKDLSKASSPALALSSLLSNQEQRDNKQFKSQMLVAPPPKADLYNTKVQSPPAMGAASSSPKQKLHKTDAPMLNYIFDSHAPSKKHNHNFRWVNCMDFG
jgi:hypothetical protein